MSDTDVKRCERCGQPFQCRPEALETCQCVDVRLSPQTLEKLAEEYADCLCARCLAEIERLQAA